MNELSYVHVFSIQEIGWSPAICASLRIGQVKTGMFSGKKAYDVAATDEIKELVKPKK